MDLSACVCHCPGPFSVPADSAVDCGDPGTPTNGQHSLSSTTYNSVVTYTCDVGYTLQGSNKKIKMSYSLHCSTIALLGYVLCSEWTTHIYHCSNESLRHHVTEGSHVLLHSTEALFSCSLADNHSVPPIHTYMGTMC